MVAEISNKTDLDKVIQRMTDLAEIAKSNGFVFILSTSAWVAMVNEGKFSPKSKKVPSMSFLGVNAHYIDIDDVLVMLMPESYLSGYRGNSDGA